MIISTRIRVLCGPGPGPYEPTWLLMGPYGPVWQKTFVRLMYLESPLRVALCGEGLLSCTSAVSFCASEEAINDASTKADNACAMLFPAFCTSEAHYRLELVGGVRFERVLLDKSWKIT